MGGVTKDYLDLAELSMTAYAELDPGFTEEQVLDALEDATFAESQAGRFTDQFSIDHQFTDPGFDETGYSDSGFSVTVFANSDNKYFIAFRGTEVH